jgi:hypothetical protein
MNLESIAPILEQIIKETLLEKRYPFGFARFKGVSNKKASGTLVNSVRVVSDTRNNMPELLVIMANYAEYVQSGRAKGKKGVPIQSLIEWIKERNLQPRSKDGRFQQKTDKNIKGMAFGIQKNIKKYGIRSANFIDITLEKIMEDPRIVELIGDQTYEDLIDSLSGI